MTSLLFWSCAALTLLVLAGLIRPLIRFAVGGVPRRAFDVQVYHAQLNELERDLSRGILTEDQAQALRLEIQRRILAADADEGAEKAPQATASNRRFRLIAACVVLFIVPIGSFGLYLKLGSPLVAAQPMADRLNSPDYKLTQLAERMAEELRQRPEPKGYAMLGGALLKLHRYDEAAQALGQAVAMGARDVDTLTLAGEALVMAGQGMVGPEARQMFLQSLAVDKANPRARFYIGLGYAQLGKANEALAIWRDLEQSSPADAPWLEMLRGRIATVAKDFKLDPASVSPHPPTLDGVAALPSAPPAPANGAAAAAGEINQSEMIQQMVARLAKKMEQNPEDLAGWLKLSRAYRVLGRLDEAESAARQALRVQPEGVEPRMALADVQLGRSTGDQLPADFIATMRDILARDPENTDALYYVGAAELQIGHPAKARQIWTSLLALLPEGSDERGDLQKQINGLKD